MGQVFRESAQKMTFLSFGGENRQRHVLPGIPNGGNGCARRTRFEERRWAVFESEEWFYRGAPGAPLQKTAVTVKTSKFCSSRVGTTGRDRQRGGAPGAPPPKTDIKRAVPCLPGQIPNGFNLTKTAFLFF